MSRPWYEAAFGADYLERYRHRDADEARSAVRTLLRGVDLPDSVPVLDLCCGAGRHAAALRAEGHHVVGLDLSADLLGAAVELFREQHGCGTPAGRDCPAFVRGDKRRLPFADGAFSLVTHFFTAFGYFEDDEENYGVFGEVARVLRPGGWYLFDFLNAAPVREELKSGTPVEGEEVFPDGARVETLKRLTPDGTRVEKRVRLWHGGVLRREFLESVRLFTPSELRGALRARGLEPVKEWGGYDDASFEEDISDRWIVLSRRS